MATQVIKTTFQFKRGQSAAFTEKNVLLAAGEPAYELDTGRLKLGNGVTYWNDLQYFGGTGVLRRDNEYNYDPLYVPLKGEVLLIDVPSQGLKIKIGDGYTAFKDLSYYQGESGGEYVVPGYYSDGNFYKDYEHTIQILVVLGKIYIDQSTSKIYTYNGEELIALVDSLPRASDTVFGLVQIYDTITEDNRSSVAGGPTMRLFLEELAKKTSVDADSENEVLRFY